MGISIRLKATITCDVCGDQAEIYDVSAHPSSVVSMPRPKDGWRIYGDPVSKWICPKHEVMIVDKVSTPVEALKTRKEKK